MGRKKRERENSDSDAEPQAPKKRTKRFKFQTFAERVENGLGKWRELCSAQHWLEVAAALHPLSQSLAQLLHHQNEVLDLLLGGLRMDAALSLEPLLELVGVLARDLQEEFLPHLPRVAAALADLVDEGLDREPELLGHVFTCLSLLCKHLARPLGANLLPPLRATARLRHHGAHHVRVFAAQALGYLIRQAPPAALRAGVKAVLSEAVARPTPERLHAAGVLLAEAATGVGNGLHSRGAPAVLGLLLREGLVGASDFRRGAGAAGAPAAAEAPQGNAHGGPAAMDEDGEAAAAATEAPARFGAGAHGRGRGRDVSEDEVHARVAAVASICLERLLDHTRRGTCGELWALALREAEARLERQAGTEAAGAQADAADAAAAVAAARRSTARGLALLAQMVEYGRGARVESYAPLFALAARLARPELLGGTHEQRQQQEQQEQQQQEQQEQHEQQQEQQEQQEQVEEWAPFFAPSLPAEVLRLLLALVRAHAKQAGASVGPPAVAAAAPQWAAAFTAPPAAEVLLFVAALIAPPAGGELAACFGPAMLGFLGRRLLARQQQELCWPLLVDVCACLRPDTGAAGVPAGGALPVILTATGVGRQLAALVRSTLDGAADALGSAGAGAEPRQLAVAWAALRCLPHAAESPLQEAACCARLAATTGAVVEGAPGRRGSELEPLLLLHCAAVAARARVAARQQQARELQDCAAGVLLLAATHPGSYHVVSSAAEVLRLASAAAAAAGGAGGGTSPLESLLTLEQLAELLPLLQANLSSASGALRRETLRLLARFPQPALLPPSGGEGGGAPSGEQPPPEQQPCEVLAQLLAVEDRQHGANSGRTEAVALGRIANQLEYRRIPSLLLPAVVHSLLGVLHIRFSALWSPAAEALAMALDCAPATAWPLILQQLTAAQEAFLAGGTPQAAAHHPPTAAHPHGHPLHVSGAAVTPGPALRPLAERFAEAAAEGAPGAAVGGSTDAATRLAHLLKALARAPHTVVESRAKEWVLLFLAYCAAKSADGVAAAGGGEAEAEEEEEEGEEQEEQEQGGASEQAGEPRATAAAAGTRRAGVPAHAWRAGLAEWLSLLAGLRGVRGMWGGEPVQCAVAGLLLDPEPSIQAGALKCLKARDGAFRLRWLAPYLERLLRLADNKTLRAELTAFPLAPKPTSVREDDDVAAVQPEHRAALVPLLVRLLFPKMRKRSGRLGGKGAPGSARAAILNFLSACPPAELSTLLELFLDPLSVAFVRPAGEEEAEDDGGGAAAHRQGDDAPLLERPWRRIGYLNTLEDLLKHLGHQLQQYLPALLALALCLLEGGVAPLRPPPRAAAAGEAAAAEAEGRETAEGAREVRTRCLHLIAGVLERFPAAADYNFLWARLTAAAEPLLPRLAGEAAADRAPPLLALAAALASSQHLASVLADGSSSRGAAPAGASGTAGAVAAGSEAGATAPAAVAAPAPEVVPCPEPWAADARRGSRLLAQCVAALSAPTCAEPARMAMLGALESLFDLPDPLPQQVLGPHMPALLAGLQAIVVAVWQQQRGGSGGGAGPARRRGGDAPRTAPKRATAARALAILELVGSRVGSWEAAGQLTEALLLLLAKREGHGGRRRGAAAEEEMVTRTLAVLAALWGRLAQQDDAGPAATAAEAAACGAQLRRVAAALAPLAGSLEGGDARRELCAAMVALGGVLPEAERPAELLGQLNAMSTAAIDELDYESRLAAYAQLLPTAWAGLAPPQAAPLLHHCFHDLRNAGDLALRHAAAQALARFVAAAAAEGGTDGTGGECAERGAGAAAAAAGGLSQSAQRLVFPQLKRGLAAPSLAVRQEHLALLRALVIALPHAHVQLLPLATGHAAAAGPGGASALAAAAADGEADFLSNVAHLQLHRRARAFMRLARLLGPTAEGAAPLPCPVGLGALVGVVLPLVQQAVLEGAGGGGEGAGGHDAKAGDKDRGANVADAAITALAAVAAVLPWVQYQQVLGQYLRLMGRHAEGSGGKAVVRAVCGILDSFPHFLGEAGKEEGAEAGEAGAGEQGAEGEGGAAGAAPAGAEAEAVEEDEEAEDEGAAAEGGAGEDQEMGEAAAAAAAPAPAAPPAAEARRLLARRVVPQLRRQLVVRDAARPPVALAIVRVLLLLPEAAVRAELPRTLQTVANLLKSRLQRVRDDARAVLVAMLKELGPHYVPFACDCLQSACPQQGYTAHVLGYTLHAVLEGVAAVVAPGSLDDSLALILPLMEADLFGYVAEAKEASEFASAYKEAKKCRAYDTYRILASLISFGPCVTQLLSTVRDRLAEASHPKTRTKLQTLLQSAVRGCLANPTATAEDICMFLFATAEAGLAAEEAAREAAEGEAGAAVATGASVEAAEAAAAATAAALHQHLLVEFALSLFLGVLKKGLVNPRAPDAAPLLAPLLPLLVRALRSRHAPSVGTALSCLCLLVQAELPGLDKAAADAGKAVTTLLKRCPKTTHPIAQARARVQLRTQLQPRPSARPSVDCFKLLAALLRQCGRYSPSQSQLRFLMGWAFTDLEESATKQTAFHLLKAILSRKIVLPEVYDLMNRVQELMVQSQAAQVRALASSALLQFLLDYPLGETRLAGHLQFLLTNLGYEHESGRAAAVDMLATLLAKFPAPVVEGWAEMVFLPLVARLVNDPSSKCRATVGAALGLLLRRLGPAPRGRLAGYCLRWLGGRDARLARAAAQALGILAEAEGPGFGRRAPVLLPPLARVLGGAADTVAAAREERGGVEGGTEDGDDAGATAAGASWQEVYYCLLLLQRLLEAAAGAVAWAAGAPATCWRSAAGLLLHRHLWVRKAAGRLVGGALADPGVGPAMLDGGGARAPGALALAFFRQLDSDAADEALAGQAVKCLVFLAAAMHEEDEAAGRLPPPLRAAGAGGAAGGAAGAANGRVGGAAARRRQQEQEQGQGQGRSDAEAGVGEEQQGEDGAGSSGSEEEEEDEEEGGGGGGLEEEDEEAAEEAAAVAEEAAAAAAEAAAGSLSLAGLARRMARLADDKTYARQLQRGVALRFIAALASRLGAERVAPFLPVLLRPLYRITEPGAAGNPEEVKQLAEEVVAHLRSVAGADALLAGYAAAREEVRAARAARKRRAAQQSLVDPEAAAKRRMAKQRRKAAGRRKKVEDVRRKRAAGVFVKNKQSKRQRGE
eukprot:scaffold5.g887.t1